MAKSRANRLCFAILLLFFRNRGQRRYLGLRNGRSNPQSLDCAAIVKALCTGYADDLLGENNRR
jgi:hypothetical protein